MTRAINAARIQILHFLFLESRVLKSAVLVCGSFLGSGFGILQPARAQTSPANAAQLALPGAQAKKAPIARQLTIPSAVVALIREQKAVFAVSSFGKIRVGERFYLLNSAKSGVTVEFEVERLSADGQFALAKPLQNPLEIQPENFVASTLVRAADVKARPEQFGEGPISVESLKRALGSTICI